MNRDEMGETVPGTRRKTTEEPTRDVASDELLSTSPFTGDLGEELAAAEPRPRRRLPSVTLLLGAGVLLAAGFAGGVQADKHWGAKSANDPAALLGQLGAGGSRRASGGGTGGGGAGGGFGGGFGGQSGQATGPGGAAGGAPGGGSATTGTVKLVDGDILYVQTANGIVRVKTDGGTKVGVQKSAKLNDLKAGAPVTVQGTPGQDGTVTATTVTQSR